MDWNQPIGIDASKLHPLERAVALLGHYDCRVFTSNAAYVDVGAGSLSALTKLCQVPEGFSGSMGSIGRYTEINATARIIVQGEHDHDRAVNIRFSALQIHQTGYSGGVKALVPFKIGSGVVISHNATILSGRAVGDGAVIGAGAVLTRDVQPYEIVAGAPAKLLRTRAPGVDWWNFDTVYLLANLPEIEVVAQDRSRKHRYRIARPQFVLLYRENACEIVGFMDAGRVAPIAEAPAKVREYLLQVAGSADPYWLADCWG